MAKKRKKAKLKTKTFDRHCGYCRRPLPVSMGPNGPKCEAAGMKALGFNTKSKESTLKKLSELRKVKTLDQAYEQFSGEDNYSADPELFVEGLQEFQKRSTSNEVLMAEPANAINDLIPEHVHITPGGNAYECLLNLEHELPNLPKEEAVVLQEKIQQKADEIVQNAKSKVEDFSAEKWMEIEGAKANKLANELKAKHDTAVRLGILGVRFDEKELRKYFNNMDLFDIIDHPHKYNLTKEDFALIGLDLEQDIDKIPPSVKKNLERMVKFKILELANISDEYQKAKTEADFANARKDLFAMADKLNDKENEFLKATAHDYEQSMSNYENIIHYITNDPKLSADEKRDRIFEVKQRINESKEIMVERLDNLAKKTGKYDLKDYLKSVNQKEYMDKTAKFILAEMKGVTKVIESKIDLGKKVNSMSLLHRVNYVGYMVKKSKAFKLVDKITAPARVLNLMSEYVGHKFDLSLIKDKKMRRLKEQEWKNTKNKILGVGDKRLHFKDFEAYRTHKLQEAVKEHNVKKAFTGHFLLSSKKDFALKGSWSDGSEYNRSKYVKDRTTRMAGEVLKFKGKDIASRLTQKQLQALKGDGKKGSGGYTKQERESKKAIYYNFVHNGIKPEMFLDQKFSYQDAKNIIGEKKLKKMLGVKHSDSLDNKLREHFTSALEGQYLYHHELKHESRIQEQVYAEAQKQSAGLIYKNDVIVKKQLQKAEKLKEKKRKKFWKDFWKDKKGRRRK